MTKGHDAPLRAFEAAHPPAPLMRRPPSGFRKKVGGRAGRSSWGGDPQHRRSRGVTFIELMAVVAISGLLAVVGVHQLTRARMTAREQISLSNLRGVVKACEFYFTVYRRYPPDLDALGPAQADPPFLEGTLTENPYEKQGYQFAYAEVNAGEGYSLEVSPTTYGSTGNRRYLTTEEGRIYYTDEDRAVDPDTDPTIP